MENKSSDINNIYNLDGRVPVAKAIPFGLQHILAMFVANIAPILIVANACGLSEENRAMLIQSAMLIAGLGTIIQLYPVWKIGSRLPIVMGISFTFVSVLCYIGPTFGYGTVMGAVLGNTRTFCEILEKDNITYSCSKRCYIDRIFVIGCRSDLIWRRFRCRGLRLG